MPGTRVAGKRGRLPVKRPAERLSLQYLSSYLRSPLPAPVYPIDVSGGITDWGMLGNGPDPTTTLHPNGVGDCTFASLQHYRLLKSAAGADSEPPETSNDLVAEYIAYNNGRDVGASVADLLLHLYKAGKIFAFAPVDHTNPAEVDAAMAAFHGVYVGVNLTEDVDDLFEHDRPWTTSSGQQPDPGDGHCVVKLAANGEFDQWVTWGAVQKSTREWTAAAAEEAWVVIPPEDAAAVDIDIDALRADIDALHGTSDGNAHDAPLAPPVPVQNPAATPTSAISKPSGADDHIQQALAQIAKPGRLMFNPPKAMVLGRPARP